MTQHRNRSCTTLMILPMEWSIWWHNFCSGKSIARYSCWLVCSFFNKSPARTSSFSMPSIYLWKLVGMPIATESMNMVQCCCSVFCDSSWPSYVHSEFWKILILQLNSFSFSTKIQFYLCSFSRHVGRRKFLLSSGLGMTLCTLTAAIFMHFEHAPIAAAAGGDSVLLICVLGYVCCSSLGVLVIVSRLIVDGNFYSPFSILKYI